MEIKFGGIPHIEKAPLTNFWKKYVIDTYFRLGLVK